jgi:hypothetical protein
VFQSAAASQGTCGVDAGTVQCELGEISDGASAAVTITVRTTVVGTVENIVSVASAEGESASATAATTVQAPPAAPTDLTATISTGGRIRLSWMDPADNETGFQVERRARGRFARIATVPADTTTFEDLTAVRGQTYTYRVRAVNGVGVSAYSNEVTLALLVGQLTVRNRSVAFRAKVGAQDTRRVSIRNTGRAPLTVTVSSSGAPFTVIDGSDPVVRAPGASQSLTGRVAPTSAGSSTGSLDVSTTRPPAATVSVQLTGAAR